MSVPQSDRSELLPVLGIALVWVAMVVLVNPLGDFPLNDDWCYGRAVKTLVEEGWLQILDVATVTLVAQVLWGALFCVPFGFSFTALRFSTLVLGLIGVVGAYLLLREARVHRRTAMIGCMAVAVNPIFFELSNTFMTDVPFFAVSVMSLYAFARGIRKGSNVEVVIGALLSAAATLIRQSGVVLPLAFGVAYLVKNGFTTRSLVRALLPAVVAAATLIGYLQWLKFNLGVPSYYRIQLDVWRLLLSCGPVPIVSAILRLVLSAAMYLGLFLFPFLIPAFAQTWRATPPGRKLRSLLLFSALFVVVLVGLLHYQGWVPVNRWPGDIFIDFGVGPATLRDVFVLHFHHLPAVPPAFWVIVTVIGAVGGSLLLRHFCSGVRLLFCGNATGRNVGRACDKGVLALFVSALVLYLAPIVPLVYFACYDRYYLLMIPLFMVLVVCTIPPIRAGRVLTAVAAVILLAYGLFAVAATHDYLEWNRARWSALNYLTRKAGVEASDIDGGYEFNGWCDYSGPEVNLVDVGERSYVVTFGPMPGYEEIRRYPFRRWIPHRRADIFVLRKVNASSEY